LVDSPRRRWHYFAISVAGLLVGLWALRGLLALSAPPSGPAADSIRYPARVGTVLVGSPGELRFIAQSRPAGSILDVRSADGGVLRTRLVPQLSRFHFGIIVLEGLVFLAVNLIVFAPRVDRGPIRDLYWCTLLYGVATMINGPYFPRSGSWTEWALPVLWITCLTLLPGLFFRMAQTFPRERPLLVRRPSLMRGLWIAAAILIVWQSAAFFRYFVDPRPSVWQGTILPRSLGAAFLVAAVALGCLTLYRSGRKLELSREREQTKWLLWGFTIGVTPYVFLRTLPKLAGLESTIPPELDRIFELAIPIAFTFAVVRYRFLDIDIIIRRSLIYGILAGVLAGIYLLVGVVAAQRIAERIPRYAGLIQILAVALPVILYTPTRRWIGTWVDRTFFKIQYDYAQALLAFQDQVRGASSQEEIASVTRGFLEEQLGLQRAAALVQRGMSFAAATDLEVDQVEPLAGSVAHQTSRKLIAAPNSTSRPDLETTEFPQRLAAEGFRIAVPVATDGRCLGVLLVGEKKSERRFIEEDLKLLYTVRAEVAAALERVELVQKASEETLAREKAEELERLKSDFFSRVAHDLRTPLTAIRWTVQNLLDGVRGAPSAEHVPQLQAVDAAATQLGRLVNNLLDLSRLEAGAHAEHGPVDLYPLVQEAVSIVKPTAQARNVRFDVSVATDLKPVRGDRNQLLEIVTNLLENAVRYSPDGEAVDIALDRNGEGQRLVVRDRGPGISATESDRIFERFEQGRPSPYSRERGFGLGLYVTRSYLEQMHGTVNVDNHPEGGARFVCVVPEWRDS
jgi:signal transduction histidine kinase